MLIGSNMRGRFVACALVVATGCSEEQRGLSVRIDRVGLTVDRAAPDGLADLQLSVELVAHRQGATARVDDLTAVTLPDADLEFAFGTRLIGRVGEVAEVTLASGETLGVRVLNDSVTNAALMGVCGRPMDLTVVFDDDGRRPEDTDTVTPACRN